MPFEISMPQLSDTMTEGTVAKWLKKEGDKVKAGEIIAEIETDKAVMEMESFESGTLAHIAVADAGKAPVGAVIGVLAIGSESPSDVKKKYAGGKGAAAPAAAPAASVAAAPSPAPAARPPAPITNLASGGTLIAASTGEIHERADVGHGATRERPTAVPPLPSAR